jgi:hypothetical protein
MPNPVTGLMAASSLGSAAIQSSAAKKAASATTQSAEAAIEEQRRQFDAIQALMKPFVETGTTALSQQAALLGIGGADAQRTAISALEQGPQFQSLVQQGENAIMQSAAATGGLRGGNVQAALAQFRPQILSGLIEQQYSRLGGLATAGQNAAGNLGTFGQTTGANVGNLYGNIGQAQGGLALARGNTFGNLAGDFGQYLGQIQSGAIPNPFGGGTSLAPTTSIRPMGRPY